MVKWVIRFAPEWGSGGRTETTPIQEDLTKVNQETQGTAESAPTAEQKTNFWGNSARQLEESGQTVFQVRTYLQTDGIGSW